MNCSLAARTAARQREETSAIRRRTAMEKQDWASEVASAFLTQIQMIYHRL